MTLNSLIDKIYQRLFERIKKHEIRWILNFVIEETRAALCAGEEVKLQNLGTFRLNYRKGKKVRHPATGKIHSPPPHHAVCFIPAGSLKKIVRNYKKI
ncbi:MAG: hypothetical protein A2096_16000 [Spirochaetes bacterium GWF1_41_5]|nr:MAG: hypothetical protein A2096_16000 [Spirochaetes bacterium GWF1_41_5]HBE04123.1 hypothetical protein [Spirochaetia bacterium]